MTRLFAYARGILRRRLIDAEMDDELRFHLDQEIAAHVARGVDPAEARRLALRDLGGLIQTQEAVRDVRTIWIDLWWRDALYAARRLWSTPGFTLVALAVLTLSIGASTAIFSVVDAVILRGLPFDESDRLVAVSERTVKESPDDERWGMAAPQNFLDWRAQQDVFTGLAAIAYGGISLRPEGQDGPETLRSHQVTADFFSVLRVQPLLGRPFAIENEVQGQARVAVISYALWQRRFGGAPDVLGRHLPGLLGDFEILGVMPPGFTWPVGATQPDDVWVPYVVPDDQRVRGHDYGYYLRVIGRLRDGVSIERAQAQMDHITAVLAAETPGWFTDRVAAVEPLRDFLTGGVRRWMLMLLAAVGFVLLIACVNLASLMLVRASSRGRELRTRAALGASRWDLARVLLLEALILSLAGAALGAGLAGFGVEVLRAAMPAAVPRVADIAVDLRVLIATGLAAIGSGVAIALAPVLQFAHPAAARGLAPGDRATTSGAGARWLRAGLVVAEVALAVMLLAGSTLFLASFARVTSVNVGVDYRDVLTVRVRPLVGPNELHDARQHNVQRMLNVLDRVRAIPGVEVASLVGGGLPFRGDLITRDVAIPGRELPRNQDIDLNQISPGYFAALRVPLLAGRMFTDADHARSQPVVILNEAAARRYFGREDAIGQTVRVTGERTVVGIVGNIRHEGPETDWRTQAFVPIAQSDVLGATLVVRMAAAPRALSIVRDLSGGSAAGDATHVVNAIRTAVWSELPNVPLPDIHMLEHYYAALVAQRRFSMLLLGLFGLLGIVIAAVGIYGVMGYLVTQRTQEIGIRMALGARPSAILRSVLQRALAYVGVGLAIGVAGAWMLAGLVETFLFRTEPHEPAIYVVVCVTLVAVGVTAAFFPARRASRVDPLVAIRSAEL